MTACDGPVMPTVRPPADQLKDLPGGVERLARPRRSLGGQVRLTQRHDEPERRVVSSFTRPAQCLTRQQAVGDTGPQQQRGRGVAPGHTVPRDPLPEVTQPLPLRLGLDRPLGNQGRQAAARRSSCRS